MVDQFKKLVGAREYTAFMNLLKQVGPHARTHRISVVIAAMLHYARSRADEGAAEGTLAYALIALEEEPHLSEESGPGELLFDLISALCKEAKMRNLRISSRGDEYSIAENTIAEYVGWDSMPWERY